jgi:hypothetical protein
VVAVAGLADTPETDLPFLQMGQEGQGEWVLPQDQCTAQGLGAVGARLHC